MRAVCIYIELDFGEVKAMLMLERIYSFFDEKGLKLYELTERPAHQMLMFGRVFHLLMAVYLPKPPLLDQA
jgi:hypothetical protein